MPHIPLPDEPGIGALLAYKPSTGAVLSELMHRLLRDEGPVPPAWRELIGGHVSARNRCEYCARTHTAVACALDPDLRAVADSGAVAADVDPQLSALLRLAEAVVDGGAQVQPSHVADARDAGASDEAIHDTVLVAAAFCMINRYVDGLDVLTPRDEDHYRRSGAVLAEHGYRRE